MAAAPCSIKPSTTGAASSGSTSVVQTNRHPGCPSSASSTSTVAWWCRNPSGAVDDAVHEPATFVVGGDEPFPGHGAGHEGDDAVGSVELRVGDEPGGHPLVHGAVVPQRLPRILGRCSYLDVLANRGHARIVGPPATGESTLSLQSLIYDHAACVPTG